MTDPTPQPAAHAVLDAVEDDCIHPTDLHRIAAAALRAAADEVVPACSTRSDRGTQRMMIRHEFLAIANELDPQ